MFIQNIFEGQPCVEVSGSETDKMLVLLEIISDGGKSFEGNKTRFWLAK